jgi:hypothetical protein
MVRPGPTRARWTPAYGNILAVAAVPTPVPWAYRGPFLSPALPGTSLPGPHAERPGRACLSGPWFRVGRASRFPPGSAPPHVHAQLLRLRAAQPRRSGRPRREAGGRARKFPPGTLLKICDWETGVCLRRFSFPSMCFLVLVMLGQFVPCLERWRGSQTQALCTFSPWAFFGGVGGFQQKRSWQNRGCT